MMAGVQLLEERGEIAVPKGQKIVSILLFEDLMIVPLLALVAFLAPGGGETTLAERLQEVGIGIAAIVGLVFAGRYLLNPLFRVLADSQAREVMTAAALLVVLGSALAMQLSGLSMAMGAFLAGVLLSESTFRHQLEADIEPFRGILLVVFFLAGGMSLVPERRELFGSMSVEDNLLLGGFRLYRAGVSGWRAKIDEVYDLFPRLRERRMQEAGTLSGGERQMLAVGRALMAQPQLLMLDEPSLGLAPRIVREIFQIISRLRRIGVSILLVEQNARAALQVADYGYVLETGEVVLEGPSAALIGNPRVIESYLGLGRADKKPAAAEDVSPVL